MLAHALPTQPLLPWDPPLPLLHLLTPLASAQATAYISVTVRARLNDAPTTPGPLRGPR